MEPNISWLTEHLATGGDLHPDDGIAQGQIDSIVGQGITTIIDCRFEATDRTFVLKRHPDIEYIDHGIDDDGRDPGREFFVQGVRHASRALRKGRKVLVHCHMGINRGPSLAYGVLIRHYGMDPIEAYQLIRSSRPIAFAEYADYAAEHLLDDEMIRRKVYEHMRNDHSQEDVRRVIQTVRREEANYFKHTVKTIEG